MIGPEDDHGGQVLRQRHRDRADRVPQQPQDVRDLAPDQVARLAADEDERRRDQRLERDRPLHARSPSCRGRPPPPRWRRYVGDVTTTSTNMAIASRRARRPLNFGSAPASASMVHPTTAETSASASGPPGVGSPARHGGAADCEDGRDGTPLGLPARSRGRGSRLARAAPGRLRGALRDPVRPRRVPLPPVRAAVGREAHRGSAGAGCRGHAPRRARATSSSRRSARTSGRLHRHDVLQAREPRGQDRPRSAGCSIRDSRGRATPGECVRPAARPRVRANWACTASTPSSIRGTRHPSPSACASECVTRRTSASTCGSRASWADTGHLRDPRARVARRRDVTRPLGPQWHRSGLPCPGTAHRY